MLLENLVVLVFEILYYSMFMKYARKEGKFSKYLLLFSISTLLILIFGNKGLESYIIFILFSYISLKYLVKTKVSLYDMFLIIIMLIFKLVIETIGFIVTYIILSNLILYLFSISILKIILTYILRNKISNLYKKFKIKWNNNNFYIRYIFISFTYIYVIITIVLKLFFS